MTLSGMKLVLNQNVTAWRKMLSSTVTIVMPRRRSPAARQSGVTVSSQQLSLGTFQEVVFLRFTFKNHPTKSKHLTLILLQTAEVVLALARLFLPDNFYNLHWVHDIKTISVRFQ